MAQPATADDNFTFLAVLIMLLVDTILYLLIAWYFEAVYPGEYGIPKPLYFPFTVRELPCDLTYIYSETCL